MSKHPRVTASQSAAVEVAIGAWLAVMLAAAIGVGPALYASIGPILARRMGISNGITVALGVTIGAALGYHLSAAIHDAFLPTIAALFVVASLGTWFRLTSTKQGIFWLFMGVGMLAMLYLGIEYPEDVRVASLEMAGAFIVGVLTGAVVSSIAWMIGGTQPTSAQPVRPPNQTAEMKADEMAISITAGILVVVIALLWLQFDLPSLNETAITTFVIIDSSLATLKTKARGRLIGCIIGGFWGLLFAMLSVGSFFLWSLLLVLGFFTFAKRVYYDPENSYFGVQAILGFGTCMIIGFGPPASVAPVLDRFIGIFIALVIMSVLLSAIRGLFRSTVRTS